MYLMVKVSLGKLYLVLAITNQSPTSQKSKKLLKYFKLFVYIDMLQSRISDQSQKQNTNKQMASFLAQTVFAQDCCKFF